MRVPRTAFFTDYSAIAYNPKTNLVAITSQEDSKLWVREGLTDSDSFSRSEESTQKAVHIDTAKCRPSRRD